MIELKNISKQYCKETTILKDIDLCIGDGDYIALMGPSGAGKTTLMNIIGCLDRATQGEYFLTEMKSQIILKKKKPDYEMKNLALWFRILH